MKLGSWLWASGLLQGLEEIMSMTHMQRHHDGSFSLLCVTSSQYTDGSPELSNMVTKGERMALNFGPWMSPKAHVLGYGGNDEILGGWAPWEEIYSLGLYSYRQYGNSGCSFSPNTHCLCFSACLCLSVCLPHPPITMKQTRLLSWHLLTPRYKVLCCHKPRQAEPSDHGLMLVNISSRKLIVSHTLPPQ